MNLLIVDDNDDMRALIRGVVASVAETVYECGDGAAAVEAYRLHRPDLVTMDIELPSQDGLAATREICTTFPGAKILIVTAYDTAALRWSAGEAGALGYVVKENLRDIRQFLTVV